MEFLLKKYKPLKDKEFIKSTVVAVLFLILAIVITFFAITYATDHSSYSVTDIILSNTPVFDLYGIFIYGPIVFWAVIGFYLVVFRPEKVPFTFKSLALFLLVRSFFISLTHIGPFPVHVEIDTTGISRVFTAGNDLFFSSHTGMPFLAALIFWDSKRIRNFSIAASIFFGVVVLLAHLHYSIDVFAAFFITYGVFVISEKIFEKDGGRFVNKQFSR